MMKSDVAWVLQRAGFYLPVMAVNPRLRSFKFCSLKIESRTAVKKTSGVAWVLHRAGSYSLVIAVSLRFRLSKGCSLLISSGIAEKITLSVAWVIHETPAIPGTKRCCFFACLHREHFVENREENPECDSYIPPSSQRVRSGNVQNEAM